MFRAKTISTISTITSSSLKTLLQNRDSLFNIKRSNSDKSPMSYRSNRMKKKQSQDVGQPVTLGKVYLIVHLCASEIAKRGLVEPDIFNPIRFGYEKEKARYLINCLLRDKRVEFEDELKCQNIHNVIVCIRMALRNCISNIISYDNYKDFAKHEHEFQYDPNNEPFNNFLSYLPSKSQGILIELFDLFAMIMENSHVNQIHPTRILKSMSLYIFNELRTKNYADFQLAYQDWLKYSNATTHLFLSYLRERARSTKLPDRLNLLLHDYAECRKNCFTNNFVNENEKDIVFSEHTLPDITIADLNEVIISKQIFNQNDFIDDDSVNNDSFSVNTQSTYESRESSLHEFFPEIMESLAGLNFETNLESFSNIIAVNDLETARAKWKELQDKELGILSEEVLKLFFDYDTILDNEKKKRKKSQRKDERFITSNSLPDRNENINENIISDDSSRKGSNISTNINSSSFGPILSDNGDNPTTTKLKETRKQKKIRKNRMILSFLCFKCYMYTDDLGHIYEDLDEKCEQWDSNPNNLTHESELDRNQFLIQKKFSNSTDRLSNRISLSSARSPNLLPSQQFDRDIDDDLRVSNLDRSTTPIERMEKIFYDPFKVDTSYRTKVLQQNRFRRLYQDDFFTHDPSNSSIGYISMPTQFKRSSSISSNMSECSSLFGRQNIIRGKELPYPITPLRSGRQSPISPIYHSGRQSPMRPQQYFRQYSQQYLPRQYSQQYPHQRYYSQQYLQQFPQYTKYPQQQRRPIYNTRTNTNVTASTSQHDDYDYIVSENVDAPYQSQQSQQQSQLYNQQEGDYYQHSQEEECSDLPNSTVV